MKTLKFALIAALISCTLISLANTDGFKEKPKFKVGVCISLENAIKIPGLVRAMYQQISMLHLIDAHQHVYCWLKSITMGNIIASPAPLTSGCGFSPWTVDLPAKIVKEKSIN